MAIVTGGSRGIGRSCVFSLLKRGYEVGFLYQSDSEAARSTVKEGRERFGRAPIDFRANVAKAEEVSACVQVMYAKFGRIDLLINNAAIHCDKLLVHLSPDEFGRVIDINVKGIFQMTRFVLPIMMKQRLGTIVNVGSIVGREGRIGQSAYAASKAALLGFTQAVAAEAAPFGIKINSWANRYRDDTTDDGESEASNTGMHSDCKDATIG
ncbi:SDR family NAD(P)-dependent oxidoreductase [Collibacillus ludicampi]|uniref:SDR family NAD(P)-dependent oxidoreductase n=1 Tax=Collibacillus ludicampi TaxID=2771369 RepID=UPI002494A161|nr:SDR family NAD(P)-dependent oxidoreductase [Collibacillus ludicampi]